MENKYIFPDFLAKFMARIDTRTQLEASMMSMSLMACGLMVTIVYLVFYYSFPVWYKVLLVINGIAGFIFMWSFLVTTFQQYLSYMEAVEFQKAMKGGLTENAKR